MPDLSLTAAAGVDAVAIRAVGVRRVAVVTADAVAARALRLRLRAVVAPVAGLRRRLARALASPFAVAFRTLANSPTFGSAAVFRPAGGEPENLRVVLAAPSDELASSMGDAGRAMMGYARPSARSGLAPGVAIRFLRDDVSEPGPRTGDVFEVAGVAWRVRTVTQRSVLSPVWVAECLRS